MKTKHIFLFLLSMMVLSSCNSKPQKEETPETKKKNIAPVETSKKPDDPEQPYVYGIDISKFQGDEVDFLSKHRDSLGFVYCKATGGITYTDPEFTNNWARIKKDGFIRGAYHFYYTRDDAVAQAKNFTNAIKSIESTDLPPMVDVEGKGIDKSQTPEEIQKRLLVFLSEVEKTLGRKPIIYTNPAIAKEYFTDPKFGNYALWISNYTKQGQPDIPKVWQNVGWTFWQRSKDYKIVHFKDDSDVFNGDLMKLLDFIKTY